MENMLCGLTENPEQTENTEKRKAVRDMAHGKGEEK